ncbi:MAG: hypothetical protein KDE23_26525 [Caldilinea sp.]|nr:hypothetical protein [Caldilinea sp.]
MADNEPLLDAILHDLYPNRVPGELDDSLDILRLWRMIEAKGIIDAEDDRQRLHDGTLKAPSKKDGERWRQHQRKVAMWAEHDRLMRDYGLSDDED